MKTIAKIYTDFPEKFGIPRQSGLVEGLTGRIVFEPEYRSPDAVRGLGQFSHIWLLWKFSQTERERWTATVRPPRLGGKTHVGVFASRSPYRPNDIGLSSVRLLEIRTEERNGPLLFVDGVDMADGTPIYDIKPYIPLCDCHPEASWGYTGRTREHALTVDFPRELLELYPEEKRQAVIGVLAQDPRPAYVMDPKRVYGLSFAGYDVKFRVEGNRLTVVDLIKIQKKA